MNALRAFYRLSRPFWGSRSQWLAWLMLAGVIGMGLLVVQINVWINAWSKTFYDTLGAFDTDALYALMGQYSLYIGSYVLIYVYLDWLRKGLVIRWRQAMTERLTAAWLGDQAFYRLGFGDEPDNPDQRIAQDVDMMVDLSVELTASFVINLAQVGAFVVILWELSGTQTFSLFGTTFSIDGYLVWLVLVYTLLGSLVTHWVGKPLHGLNYEREHREADFRASLLRKRDHAEQIALYRGEAVERRQLAERFQAIADNWRQLMGRERNLSLFTVAFERVSLIIPVFAALPLFLAKTITLGGLMQIRSAFTAVQGSLSWFIKLYPKLVRWSAALQRLEQFERAIAASRQQVREAPAGACLCTEGLAVCRPDGSVLLDGLDVRVMPGQWVRLAGRSGLGKSTLLRTLQGLWPYCRGNWQLPMGRSLLLPQQPYLAKMPLGELLAYPDTELPNDARLAGALHAVGLPGLVARLDEQCEWDRVLSGGEQQRISLARALLYRPDTLYLDEATNQLDEASARGLLQRLKRELPGCTVIAITHQPGLAALFDNTLALEQETVPA
ncbi:ABC transporter ATP-binding protein/permease [Pseudomonas sp. 148P]|uniref:ABC transporter ATP-binding protein/permease n=1 Tax=Pseudomonas ulcerans TaxID=3115852 RepID=A0ABU7HZX6_9PSED|nr:MULTISPECIES: ABC transporter ATP-binding protein/permease [unclassified Pseudomonas]MEE1921802.1 ABC transporter ATP-binding protein/permease [Pseudomonas sp. 147P]MEE1937097.1 ABC transporter ATP-binding protein/permease [Pseudomonas sp. 148P]